MTVTAETTALPVPAPEEIAFGVRPSAFLVLSGPAAPGAAETASRRFPQSRAVQVAPPDPGFVGFEGIARLFDAVMPVVQQEAPELLADEHRPDGTFLLDPYRVKQIGISYLAEAVTFAVTRRISRESHQSALVIDRIARTVLEVQRRCPSFRRGLTLIVAHLEQWDRPSLRCLYRAVLLAEPADRLAVVATVASEPAADQGDDLLSRIAPARERFLARLAQTGVVTIEEATPRGDLSDRSMTERTSAVAPIARSAPDAPGGYDELLLAMGDALVLQNYERVYHLGRQALDAVADAEQEAQTRRLLGIAHAQLDDPVAARQELEHAAELTGNPPFAAHLHYLRGLIDTKRHYDLDTADAHYARGLSILDAAAQDALGATDPVDHRVERAWLYNGQALIKTLRAKACTDDAERDRFLSAAFDLEFRACGLIKNTAGAAPAYLRHNLMANLTFLLEISRRFDDAVRFWRRAFEPYLAADSQSFRTSFGARLGLLLFKAGNHQEGIAALEEARSLCRETSDRFGEEELCLKLGYAHAAGGNPVEAYHAYLQSLRIAHSLREADICVEALTGMLCCLAELGDAAAFGTLRACVLEALPATELAQRLRGQPATGFSPQDALQAAGIVPPRPSPKLRAYIPAVDLEGTPAEDLNRYLVWGQGALPGHGPAPTAGGPAQLSSATASCQRNDHPQPLQMTEEAS